MVNKIIITIVIAFGFLFFWYFNNGNNTQEKKSMKFSSEYTYKWDEASCSANFERKEKCISLSEYKYLCEQSEGFTKNAINLLLLSNKVYIYSRDASSFKVQEVFWDETHKTKCRVKFVVTAIINGNSTSDSNSGGVQDFIVTPKGKILVHNWSEFR